MKVFLITWSHNYGLGAAIAVAKSEEDALKMAKGAGAWDGFVATEIDTSKEHIVEARNDRPLKHSC